MGFPGKTHRGANFTGLVRIVKQAVDKISEGFTGYLEENRMTLEVHLSRMINVLPKVYIASEPAGGEQSAIG